MKNFVMEVLRSIAAVAAGLVVMMALSVALTWVEILLLLPIGSTRPTPTYLILNLCSSTLAAVVGGYVLASIARRTPILLFLLLFGIIVVVNLFETPYEQAQPHWYLPTILSLSVVGLVMGTLVRRATNRLNGEAGP